MQHRGFTFCRFIIDLYVFMWYNINIKRMFAIGAFLLHVAFAAFCVSFVVLFLGTMVLAVAGCVQSEALHKYTR